MVDEKQREACRAKDPYATQEEAEEAANQLGYEFHTKLRAYQCEWCGDWHLTSQVD